MSNSNIKDLLESYRKDIEAVINQPAKQFDINKVAASITDLPPRKWRAAEAVAIGTVQYKDAKNNLKRVLATKALEANQNKDKYPSAQDRKAFADTHPDVERAEIELIEAEAELTTAKLAYEVLDDMFTAYKKVIDFLSKQEEAERQYNRFVNEGNKNA